MLLAMVIVSDKPVFRQYDRELSSAPPVRELVIIKASTDGFWGRIDDEDQAARCGRIGWQAECFFSEHGGQHGQQSEPSS
jgi:hypothetical protein